MTKKIDIEDTSKVKLIWEVNPNDYTKEKEENLITKFSIKYGIPKNNIRIEPNIISLNENGEKLALANEVIQNIHDPNFQKKLFKKYIINNNIINYDFDSISKIDDMINNHIDYNIYDKYRRYEIKWIKWSNFMSYGENNFFDFTSLKGLVLLNGIPENQSGKSTFSNDLIKFLLFGKVSNRNRDWTLSDTFNYYNQEATEMFVEGCLRINGDDYIINRTINRPDIKKRTNKSKVIQKVSYYKIINDEKIKLNDIDNVIDNEEGINNTQTNKIIKESIGNEKDFDLVICANSDNLKSLISLKDTERGRLLARWIGLLPLEDKDKIAREKFNKEIQPKLILNLYNYEDLKEKNKNLEIENKKNNDVISEYINNENESLNKIKNFEKEKERLLLSKKEINTELSKIDINTIEKNLSSLNEKYKNKVKEKEENEIKLKSIGNVAFSEEIYKNKINEDKNLSIQIATLRNNCKHLKEEINALKKSEFCPTCGAKLKNVDNTKSITEKENELRVSIDKGIKLKSKLDSIKNEIETLDKKRSDFNQKVKLELIIDTNTVDIENISNKVKELNTILFNLNKNKDIIENNNKIDLSLNIVNENIISETKYKDNIKKKKDDLINIIKINEFSIENNNKIIKQIENDEKILRDWKLYLEMIGKNGISKMVLRDALPLINGELKRLLSDVCDFDVEVLIDDNNDVSFYLIRNGVKCALGSGSGYEQTCAGLALRVILGNISTLPRPNYIILDEILGGVAEENYDKIKILYNRIVKDYSFIFQITHLKSIIDWHDYIITIEKKDNISRILKK